MIAIEHYELFMAYTPPMKGDVEKIRAALKKPIVMIGLMGAGKTKIGGMIAEALGIPFIDADHEIEATAGCTIADIFERYGEPAFRDLERKVVTRLLSDEVKVVATGGGAVMNAQTASVIWDKSIAIWIRAELDVLVERTSRNNKRPLLKNGDPRAILKDLMDRRYPVYANAHIVVDTDTGEMDDMKNRALYALTDYLMKQE